MQKIDKYLIKMQPIVIDLNSVYQKFLKHFVFLKNKFQWFRYRVKLKHFYNVSNVNVKNQILFRIFYFLYITKLVVSNCHSKLNYTISRQTGGTRFSPLLNLKNQKLDNTSQVSLYLHVKIWRKNFHVSKS